MIMDDLRAARAPKPEKKENNTIRRKLEIFLWRLPRLFFRFAQGLPQRLSEDGTDDNVWEG